MKKLATLLLVLSISVFSIGCGGDDEADDTTTDDTTTEGDDGGDE